MDIITLKSFIPEIFFSFSIIFQLIYNVRIVNNLEHNFPIISKEVFFQTLFILFCMIYLYNDLKIEGFVSNFLVISDQGTRISKMIIMLISAFALIIIHESFKFQKINFFEFYTILFLSILSLLIMISSCDLLLFYLTMEMQALCFYILASLNRNSSFSVEAGLKYFVSGSFISGFYLLGCSLIYGCLGTINLNNINLLTAFELQNYSNELNYLVLIGIILITSTLLFKLACAPFHFWSPDVYDGAPLSSTLVFSVLPKFAIFFFFIKWINSLNGLFENISDVLLVFGILSAFVGTFFALSQNRLKRLVIYSSIAQTGFLVAGLSTNSLDSFTAVYFFLIIYLVTSILIWGHFTVFYKFYSKVSTFYSKDFGPLYLSSLSSFFKNNSIWAFSFVFIFFSISGIPPLTGFLSKMLIIYELVAANKLIGAILLILISSVSVYYYIRMIKVVYFEPKTIEIINDKTSNAFKIIFTNEELDGIYLMFALFLFLLAVLFYFPTLLLTVCQYIAIHSFGF